MKASIKTTLLASSIAALAIAATPAALARYHGNDDRGGAITFSLESGGYCDNAGCPDRFWKYPVHYGPVFVQGRWYRGPVYFRGDRYGREYWVRGGWHRDEWSGRRPGWARESHDGPALGFGYYADHGFRLGDRWRHQNNDDNGGRGGWHGGDHGDNRGGDQGDNRGGDRGDNHGGDNGDHGDNWHPDHGGQNGDNNGGRGGDWHRSDNGGDRNGLDQRDNVIHVTSATYGGATCHQPNGNVTQFLATACNGKKVCDYSVQYQVIGDPAPGCAKDFTVQWTCTIGNGGSTGAAAEAGLGSHVALQCANPGR